MGQVPEGMHGHWRHAVSMLEGREPDLGAENVVVALRRNRASSGSPIPDQLVGSP
jgi:hypothetical protein